MKEFIQAPARQSCWVNEPRGIDHACTSWFSAWAICCQFLLLQPCFVLSFALPPPLSLSLSSLAPPCSSAAPPPHDIGSEPSCWEGKIDGIDTHQQTICHLNWAFRRESKKEGRRWPPRNAKQMSFYFYLVMLFNRCGGEVPTAQPGRGGGLSSQCTPPPPWLCRWRWAWVRVGTPALGPWLELDLGCGSPRRARRGGGVVPSLLEAQPCSFALCLCPGKVASQSL